MEPSVRTPSTSDRISSTRRQSSDRDIGVGNQGSGVSGAVNTEVRVWTTLDLRLRTLDFFRRQPDDIRNINQPQRLAGLIDHRKFADFPAREQLASGRQQLAGGNGSGRAGHNVGQWQ